jgi:hypothetical protein
VMAFLGAASASALTLCSTSGEGSETNCGGASKMGKQYTGPIHAELVSGGTANFTGNLPVSCTASTISGKVTKSEPPEGTIETLTFGGCSVFGFSCTATSVNTPYKLTASSTTVVNVKSDGTGNPGASVTCFGVTCEFQTAAAGANLELTGSDTDPILHAKAVPLTVTKGPAETCGSTATWNASYTVTTPKSLWIT